MSKVKVGINGMGRIGRTVLREYFSRSETNFDIVAVQQMTSHTCHSVVHCL